MTKTVDEKFRRRFEAARQFFDFGLNNDYTNSFEPKELFVYEGNVREVRSYVSSFHYSETTPDGAQETYIGKYDHVFAGCAIYGPGVNINQYKRLVPFIEQREFRELNRLWSPDGMPKNTESKLISESLRLLKDKGVRLVLSYADPSQGHQGTIYQATNWLYLGKSNPTKVVIDTEGNTMHVRTVGIYRIRHEKFNDKSNREIMNHFGWTYGSSPGKHRYVMLLGSKKERKKMFKHIEGMIQEYPKAD